MLLGLERHQKGGKAYVKLVMHLMPATVVIKSSAHVGTTKMCLTMTSEGNTCQLEITMAMGPTLPPQQQASASL
jgi:hypothetical protein